MSLSVVNGKGSSISSTTSATWETRYSVDFSAESDQNIASGGDGNYVIDGKTWTAANTAKAPTFGVGSSYGGIQIAGSLSTGGYFTGTRAGAMISIPLSSLITLDKKTEYRITVRVDHAGVVASDYNYLGIGIASPTYNNDRDLYVARGYESGQMLAGGKNGGLSSLFYSTVGNFSVSTEEKVFRLSLLRDGRRAESADAATIATTSSWRNLYESTQRAGFGSSGVASPTLYLYASVFSAWTADITFVELRIESRDADGALVFAP